MFGVSGFLAQGRSARALVPMLWCAAAVFTPLAMLVALYYRIAGLDQSLPFAGAGAASGRDLCVATETLVRRQPRPGLCGIERNFRDRRARGTRAGAHIRAGEGLAYRRARADGRRAPPGSPKSGRCRGCAGLPPSWSPWCWRASPMSRASSAPTSARRRSSTGCSTATAFRPLSFWVAGWLLRRRADDLPARMVDAGAILFTVLLVILEIRHYVTGGDIYRPVSASPKPRSTSMPGWR